MTSPSPLLAAGGVSAGLMGVIALLWHLQSQGTSKPKIYVGDGPVKERVLGLCSLLLSSYRPSFVASNAHIQTVIGLLRGLTIPSSYNRQIIMSHDGGTLALDWWKCSSSSSSSNRSDQTPIILLCHGVNGGSHDGYCKWMCNAADRKGWRSCVLNYRGCNGLPLTGTGRGYSSCLTADIRIAVCSIKSLYPSAPLFVAGYSLGATFLTKYLAECDEGLHVDLPASSLPPVNAFWRSVAHSSESKSGLVAAAVVSSPVCYTRAFSKISTGLNKVYNFALAFNLRKYIHLHSGQLARFVGSEPGEMMRGLCKATVGEIEDEGLPMHFGFQNRPEFYGTSSSLQYIPSIRTPTLFLLSEDDPFLGVLPDQECSQNPWTLLAACKRGGHIAFVSGLIPVVGPAWMDKAVLEFFESNIEINSQDERFLKSRL